MSEQLEKKEASCELDGLNVSVSRSETDGVLVVQIKVTGDLEMDDDGVSPRARVYLNGDTLYENPTFDLDAFEAKFGKVEDEEEEN